MISDAGLLLICYACYETRCKKTSEFPGRVDPVILIRIFNILPDYKLTLFCFIRVPQDLPSESCKHQLVILAIFLLVRPNPQSNLQEAPLFDMELLQCTSSKSFLLKSPQPPRSPSVCTKPFFLMRPAFKKPFGLI